MSQSIVILGAGGLARECHDIIEAINDADTDQQLTPRWHFAGFVFDGPAPDERITSRGPVLGGDEVLAELSGTHFIVAIANTSTRRAVAQRAERAGLIPATVVHPRALIGSREVHLGAGCVVAADVILTTDITLGRHVHVDRGVNIGHDTRVDDFVSFFPGAVVGGAVTIGSGSTIASASTIIQGLTIGVDVVIGAGAVVISDVRPGVTVVGVPAREVTRT